MSSNSKSNRLKQNHNQKGLAFIERIDTVIQRILSEEKISIPHLNSPLDHKKPVVGTKKADSLTSRECEVLQFMAHGKSNKFIAHQLFISEDTVRTHRRNIRKKLGITDTSNTRIIKYMEWWSRIKNE